jgi:hypothetical protein
MTAMIYRYIKRDISPHTTQGKPIAGNTPTLKCGWQLLIKYPYIDSDPMVLGFRAQADCIPLT